MKKVSPPPYLPDQQQIGEGRKVFIETYGCQMNVSDSEIVASVMQNSGFSNTPSIDEVRNDN